MCETDNLPKIEITPNNYILNMCLPYLHVIASCKQFLFSIILLIVLTLQQLCHI